MYINFIDHPQKLYLTIKTIKTNIPVYTLYICYIYHGSEVLGDIFYKILSWQVYIMHIDQRTMYNLSFSKSHN